MPPYMRDTPACVTMAFKWSRCSGKNVLSTSAPDAERQLWPEGYAGWLGFPTAGTTVISGSACHGRMNQYVSFASQQPICASNIVALGRANRCVASRSERPCWVMPSVATWIQNPAVVGVPTLSAQQAAIPICSVVRVSEICRISSRAATNAADPNAGGGPGRNWLAEVRNQGVTPGSCPPAIVGGLVLLIQNPGPVGMVPVNARLKPSVCARATI